MSGKPVVKGTRLSADFLLGLLAAGWNEAQLLDSYPNLSRESLRSVFAFAAESARDERTFELRRQGSFPGALSRRREFSLPSIRPLVEAGCDVATAAVCLPIYGLIYPVPDPPFNLWPYLMVAWALIGLGILLFISRTRPGMLEAMGRAFSETGDEPDTAKEEVRDRQATGSAD